jgi:hypothetical protein
MKERPFQLQVVGPYYGTLKALIDIELSAAETAVLSIVLENVTSMINDPDKRAEFDKGVKALNEALKVHGAAIG